MSVKSNAKIPILAIEFDMGYGCWNQLLIEHPKIICPRHRLGLAQCLAEMSHLHQFSHDEFGLDFLFDPGSGAIPLIRVQSPQRRLEDHFTPSNPSRQHLTKYGGVFKYMLWFQHDINSHIAIWFDTWQRPKASKFSLAFLVIILLDRCVYGKVSWLDNGRWILDDMIYRNMLTVLESFVLSIVVSMICFLNL